MLYIQKQANWQLDKQLKQDKIHLGNNRENIKEFLMNIK